MIAASRRRRDGPADAFRLHREMAARSSWSVRLRRGAVLALVASVAALLLRAGLVPHLGVCLGAFAAGAALPVRGAVSRALEAIRERAGLSYETALDVMNSGSDDEFGLRSAVVERAALAVRGVRHEPAPAWWLPALAVALALALFSVGGDPARTGAGGAGTGSISGEPTPDAPESPVASDPEPEEEVEAPGDDAAGRAADEPDISQRDEDDSADGEGATAPAGDGAGGAPMSRFLDSLRERPDSPEQPEDAGAPGGAGSEPPRSEGPTSPGEGETAPERVELEQRPSSQDGGGQEPQEQGGAQAEGEGEQDGQEGEGSDSSSGDAGAESAGEDPGEGEPQAGEQPGGDGSMPSAGSEPGESQGDAETQGLVPDDGSGSDSLEEAAGAGAGSGEESDAGVAGGEDGDPELLQGVLQDGPENPAGTVRLPGDTEVALPAGRAPADYQAAAEEALSEGDLPLEYQEIIRQYFQ